MHAVLFLGIVSVVIANRLVDDSHLMVRNKRQMYYLCGSYPNQFYSTTPCAPANNQCTNGGRYLNVGCTNSAQCTPYFNGVSTCINGCCCTVPNQPPTNSNRFGFCPSGQLSEVRCSGRGQCQTSSQSCMTGLCCDNTGNEWAVTCGGLAALGSCTNGACSSGVCTASNYCCECSVGRSAGRCNNRVCPTGYTCNNAGFCCASCPGNVMPFGMCRNGQCGGGRTCVSGNICC